MGHLRTTDVWEGAEVTSLPRAAPNNPVERTGDSVVFFLFVRLSPVTRRSPEALDGLQYLANPALAWNPTTCIANKSHRFMPALVVFWVLSLL